MRLRSLHVRGFGCVEEAELLLGPGLNVLYGPNDLGKSTLVRAIRAALLLPSDHREAEAFRPWHRDAMPEVDLEFSAAEQPGSGAPPRTWRLHKRFARSKAEAELSWSNDGRVFELEQKGPGVDGKLRQMLGWGVPEARVRGTRGFPGSFLATVLLGPQAGPSAMLGQSLDDDSSESGREQLTEALQALAQDPRFKDVLDKAQRKVDEAFTSTGKWSARKGSPLSAVKQRIGGLSEELRQLDARVFASEDVRQQVLQLDAVRAEVSVARDEAEQALARTRAAFERGQQRAALQARVQAAQEALDGARAVLADRRRWRDAVERHLQGCPAAEAVLLRAREAEQAAELRRTRAEAELRAIEEGGDAEARLERQQLETRRLELQTERERAHARLRELEDVLERAEQVDAVAEQVATLGRDLAASERAASEAEAARREADGEQRLYEAALGLRRWQQAHERVQQAEAARAEAERLEQQADEQRARAQEIAQTLAAEAWPDAATVEPWHALASERNIAKARLEVGLSVIVQRSGAPTIEAVRDDAEPQRVEVGASIEAARRLRLRLGDDTEIEIQGGDPRARAALEALERRWSEQVAPELRRLDVADLSALRQRLDEVRERREQGQRLQREAEAMGRLAAARRERAAELPSLRAALEASEAALAGFDRERLAERAGDHDEATLRRRRDQARARCDEAQHRHADARSRAAGLASQRQGRVEEHQRLVAELTAAKARFPGDLVEQREAAFDRFAVVEGEQEAVESELAELDRRRAERRREAEAAVREARREADHTRTDAAAASRALEDRREQLAQAQGRLAGLESQVATIDETALAAELHRQRDALHELPEEPEVDAEQLAAAERLLHERQQALREVETALEQQRGALKQVGGAVAREDATRTREALEAAKQAERDLELDYEAWRLLAQTLREAETAEGRHLGEALGDPVHARFAALTGDRYGTLALGRDLKAAGLEVAGDLRDVRALSEGVQDQLATLLRLAVAEQLGTALVLDDHLVQTDPTRVAWFRDVLLEVAGTTQIVVLTCRPEDYLRSDERPTDEPVRDTGVLRAIDLSRVIRRAR